MSNLPPPPPSPVQEDVRDPFALGNVTPLLAAWDPATIEQVQAAYVEHGAAETSRRTGVPYDTVRAIARVTGLEQAACASDVQEARARLDARKQTQDLRRIELRETLLLATEKAVERALAEFDRGSTKAGQEASTGMKNAYAELRAEYGEYSAEEQEQHVREVKEEEIRKRAFEIRDDLAARREKHRAQ